MKDPALRTLIDQAIELDRQIREATDELKLLKSQLITEAITRPDEHAATPGAGASWQFAGATGNIVRVTFPAAKLKSTIDPESKPGQKLLAKIGPHKDLLFRPVLSYEPVVNFRDLAAQLFPGKSSGVVISLAETESSPRVAFETKQAE